MDAVDAVVSHARGPAEDNHVPRLEKQPPLRPRALQAADMESRVIPQRDRDYRRRGILLVLVAVGPVTGCVP